MKSLKSSAWRGSEKDVLAMSLVSSVESVFTSYWIAVSLILLTSHLAPPSMFAAFHTSLVL